MANPRTIVRHSREWWRLQAVASVLTATSPHEAEYVVENVYFDYGQDWMWTTICRRNYRECQILSPRQWEQIITAETPAEIAEAVEAVRSDKYFGDKAEDDAEITRAEYEKELMDEMKAEYAEQFEVDEDDIKAVLDIAKARHGEYADSFERACAEIQAENEARITVENRSMTEWM